MDAFLKRFAYSSCVMNPPICLEGPAPSPPFSVRWFFEYFIDFAINSGVLQSKFHLSKTSTDIQVLLFFFFFLLLRKSLYRVAAFCRYYILIEGQRI